MMLIYTHKITNRVRYTFRLYMDGLLGIPYKLTDQQDVFLAHTGPKFSYTQQPLGDELFIASRNLLFETGISEQTITVSRRDDQVMFFSTAKNSAMPFDLFAAGFYLVSRYEEYLPHIRDKHDRFDAHQGLAWQNGFLEIPVVNKWAATFASLLQARYPEVVPAVKNYQYISTIDIDNAYAYRYKGFVRMAGGIGKALFALNFQEFWERIRVILRMEPDPYDTYAYQQAIQKKYRLRPIYFFLVGDYGVNDKNLSVQNRKFRTLIKHLADSADVGVHPSYGSNTEPERLRTEINRLRNILHRDITRSRQHFLMLKFPETYRHLIERDISDDYSMGFANAIGFRAGICTPFHFYDLDQEIETNLRIHPFAVMDATLKYYMKLEPGQCMEKIRPMIRETRAVNGTFMSLWHNETLSEDRTWKGWRAVFEAIISEATPGEKA